MGDTWEDAAEAVVKGDKWDEEADDNVKDSWDCEDEAGEQASVVVTAKPAAPKSKKASQPKKETANNTGFVEIEGEDEWERKKRLEQIQKDRDLDVAMDLLGISEMRKGPPHPETAIFAAGPAAVKGSEKRYTLDISHLNAAAVTVVDMDALAEQIIKGLQPISTSKQYPHLLEVLCRGLLQPRDVTEVRRLASVMQDLVTVKNREKLERDRLQAASAAAAASKKPQATLGKKGGKFDMNDYGDVYDDDDDY